MSVKQEFDVVIVGGGPAGYPAAIRAARQGATVAVVEQKRLGGTCLNVGCIPTKYYCHATAAGDGRPWLEIVAGKTKVVDELVKGIEFLFSKRGIAVFHGRGRLQDGGHVAVEAGEESIILSARKGILWAPGSSAARIPGLEVDRHLVLDSDDLIDAPLDFKSIVIVGAGAIGLEWATIFKRRGIQTAVVEMMPQILPGLDADLAKRMAGLMKRGGLDIRTGVKVEGLHKKDDSVEVLLPGGEVLETARVLVAVGRQSNNDPAELNSLGIELEKGRVKIDAEMRTSLAGVWSAGDAAGAGPMLAHLATKQGLVAIANMLGTPGHIGYDAVPWAVFAEPEAAGVGLNAAQAAERGIAAREGRADYRALGRPKADGNIDGFVKILAAEDGGRILGAHALGHNAAEIVQTVTAAMAAGAAVETLAEFIAIHPTYTELVMEAAEDWLGFATHKA